MSHAWEERIHWDLALDVNVYAIKEQVLLTFVDTVLVHTQEVTQESNILSFIR
jgi:hypothetical protein